jgi:hypothetical protein
MTISAQKLPYLFLTLVALVSCSDSTDFREGPSRAPALFSPATCGQGLPPAQVRGLIGKALAEFNKGAALLEQYRYAEAAKAFEIVLELAPDWNAARF